MSNNETKKVLINIPDHIEIIEGSCNDLKYVYHWFEKDFAVEERKEPGHLKKLLGTERYKLLLAKHKVINEIVGYAFVFVSNNPKAQWVDYIAVCEEYRNAGLGSIIFNKIAEYGQEGNTGIFLEVEIPDEEDEKIRNVQKRRIKFYERLGAKRLKIDYKLPTVGGEFPMHLYFRPAPGVKIMQKEDIKDVIISVYEYIHFDVPKRNEILKSFINSVQDEVFTIV